MKKMVTKVNGMLSNACGTAVGLSVSLLDGWGPGCMFLFYEPKEPKNLKKVNLKELKIK